MDSDLYLRLVRRTTVSVERTGRFHFRMAIVEGTSAQPWEFAWGSRAHAERKARRLLKRFLRLQVEASRRDAELSETWVVSPNP